MGLYLCVCTCCNRVQLYLPLCLCSHQHNSLVSAAMKPERHTCTCRQSEIADFERFAKQDKVHEALFARIAPNIFGAEDIKKAVACLLMGGSRKVSIN